MLVGNGIWAAGPEILPTLHKSSIKGGLCVIVGSADARLAAEVAGSGVFLVQCLSPDAGKVDAARDALLKERFYGRVTVETWSGDALPYADNLVSLLIVLDAGRIGEPELLRVLRPFGQMFVKEGAEFRAVTKPMAEGMDEWTHWRHGPDRNPVSTDKLVDVPDRIQWLFPVQAVTERSHFLLANGRAFAQDRNLIIARDAGNGLPLWKAKIKVGKEFDWEYAVKGAALIASRGERVYALTEDGKLKALDAATGQPVEVYEEAGTPFDIIVADDGATSHGTIVVLCTNSVRALDAFSGSLLWKQEASSPHNLIVSSNAAFFIEGNDRRGGTNGVIFARGLRSGELLWKRDYYWARRTEMGGFGFDHLVYEVRPPFNWREFYVQRPEEKKQDTYRLAVISAKTGEEVQKLERVGSSARHGEFFRGFWFKEQLLIETQTREGLGIGLFNLGDFSKPATVFKANYVGDKGWGHCYPPVLTDRFYINGQLNFTDLKTRKQVSNQITRGACNTSREGYIPPYGMIYTFPKHCVCFPMLDGNACLAPACSTPPPETSELQRGPAWPAKPEPVDYSKDWPTFRHDATPTTPLSFVWPRAYQVSSKFWQARLKSLIVNWIPHCVAKIEDPQTKEGPLENFVQAGKKLAGQPAKHTGPVFANTWTYNTLESMCLALLVDPQGDAEIAAAQTAMRKTIDDWIPKSLSVQEPDGYIHTMYTIQCHKRWSNKHDHEGYMAGYFLEAGIAHYLVTVGKDTRLFDAAKRLADCWVNHIGSAPQKAWYEGHQEFEQALARFARFVEEKQGAGQGASTLPSRGRVLAATADHRVRLTIAGLAKPELLSGPSRPCANQLSQPEQNNAVASSGQMRATDVRRWTSAGLGARS